MDLTRRQMLMTSAMAAATFLPLGRALASVTTQSDAVDAGKLSDFQKEGVYRQYDELGFFLISHAGRLVAQSSVCTHKGGRLVAQGDGFVCPRHHAAFALDGQVLRPPAKADLPRYGVRLENGHVMVRLSEVYRRDRFDVPGVYIDLAAK